ncbi:hypothetical protein FKM82_030982 [Ascaphus truei]
MTRSRLQFLPADRWDCRYPSNNPSSAPRKQCCLITQDLIHQPDDLPTPAKGQTHTYIITPSQPRGRHEKISVSCVYNRTGLTPAVYPVCIYKQARPSPRTVNK